jgi:hypothetical protein
MFLKTLKYIAFPLLPLIPALTEKKVEHNKSGKDLSASEK